MLFPYGEKLQFKTLTMSQCLFHQEGNNITVSDLISGDRVEVEVIYTATGPYGFKLRKYKCSHCAFFFSRVHTYRIGEITRNH